MREVEYEAHAIRVVVAALRNCCYGCSVAPSPFGVFVLRPRCSHTSASGRHAERTYRRACVSMLPVFTWRCDRLASGSFAAGGCSSMGLHRSRDRSASRIVAPAWSWRLYSGSTWSLVRGRAVNCRVYYERRPHIQSSRAGMVVADGLPLHRLSSKRTSGGVVSAQYDEWMHLNGSTNAGREQTIRPQEVLMAARVDVERLIGTAFLVLGFATTTAGLLVLREWPAVSSVLATLGLLWTLSGSAMMVSAVWLIFIPLGRQRRLPLSVGGGGGILSGVLIMAGFLTHVIPCTSPA